MAGLLIKSAHSMGDFARAGMGALGGMMPGHHQNPNQHPVQDAMITGGLTGIGAGVGMDTGRRLAPRLGDSLLNGALQAEKSPRLSNALLDAAEHAPMIAKGGLGAGGAGMGLLLAHLINKHRQHGGM